jgi:hypothetical protein
MVCVRARLPRRRMIGLAAMAGCRPRKDGLQRIKPATPCSGLDLGVGVWSQQPRIEGRAWRGSRDEVVSPGNARWRKC